MTNEKLGKIEPHLIPQDGEIRVGTDSSPELAQDISRLQARIGDALDFYYELRDKHGELPGWEMVEDKLTVAIGWADTPLEPIPEEEE